MESTDISRRPVSEWPLWKQYALSLGAVLVAMAFRMSLDGVLADRLPYVTIFTVLLPLVLLVRPGPFLAGSVLGCVGALFLFIPPRFTFRIEGPLAWLQFGLFLFAVSTATLTAWLSQRARQRARRDDAMLRAFVDESPTCKWVTDQQGRIVYMNRAMAEALGKRVRDVLGKTHAEILAPKLAKLATDQIRAVRESGQPRMSFEEIEPLDGQGAKRILEWRRFALRVDEHDHVMVAGMANDVTEKSRIERALHDSEERLSAQLAERESLLESERAARAEAEQATRVKDEFLATLSHELRTPLNAILGWIQLIERNPQDTNLLREALPVISRNAKVQMDLMSDLLDSSRIISGKVRLEVETLDFAKVVHAAVEAVAPTAEAKNIRLEKMVDHFTEPVRGDASRLQQVVWNLLSNAVKFTPKGGRIQVIVSKKGSMAQLVVSDTGDGISREFLPHVFERFRQADASTAKKFGGLGLGLSIVQHLVELHGGTVRVESDGAGKGATFTVEIPIAIASAPIRHSSDEDAADMPCAVQELDLSGVKVLAVDDQADATSMLRRILEECHARVITAESAQEALAILPKERPDVILCDIGMPDRDGYAFVKELRESGDETPAIAVTAFARPEDKVRSLRAGYHAHVSKPIDASELVSTVAVFAKPRISGGGQN